MVVTRGGNVLYMPKETSKGKTFFNVFTKMFEEADMFIHNETVHDVYIY